MSTPIKKRRRAPYSEQRRFETGRTRQMMSCIRCHTQRIRCEMNPGGDHLPCVKCSNFTPRIFFLGCLRYKITDSVLFRTSFGPYTFYKNHPVVGPDYGDFSLQKTRSWVGEEVHVLETTQDMGSVCRLEVRQFEPPEEIDAVDVKGRSMYYIPWAIADEDRATLAVNNFLDECMVPYLSSLLDEGDELVWEVFTSAIRFGYVLRKQSVVRDVLRLWVACRFMEGKWRCCGRDTLGAGELKNPFRSADWVSPPPYIDYQSGSITAERILSPLRVSVLRTLQDLVEEKKPENWYTTFLVTFILLHNYERGVAFQRAFWAKRKAKLLYLDMPLIRGIHSGAKAILAYFHWSCKGNIPFAADFNWNSKKAQSMANIDAEQASFMVRLGNLARQKADEMENISRSDNYDTPYWFTSQIFEGRWSPRDTLEHSPPAQPLTPAAVYGPAAPPLAS
ncbi:hypothetical protein BGZ57DRAFT_778314 [Hyaloscypha finlandica]|nr:hypothetical protein BGZ57DRAFT_778314 [Hyaloscypha finlandica]